jgi:hypothetical protein
MLSVLHGRDMMADIHGPNKLHSKWKSKAGLIMAHAIYMFLTQYRPKANVSNGSFKATRNCHNRLTLHTSAIWFCSFSIVRSWFALVDDCRPLVYSSAVSPKVWYSVRCCFYFTQPNFSTLLLIAVWQPTHMLTTLGSMSAQQQWIQRMQSDASQIVLKA